MKQSRTMAPGLDDALMMRSSSASGFLGGIIKILMRGNTQPRNIIPYIINNCFLKNFIADSFSVILDADFTCCYRHLAILNQKFSTVCDMNASFLIEFNDALVRVCPAVGSSEETFIIFFVFSIGLFQ